MTNVADSLSISVMMPAYNAELYVGQALDSLIAQSYPHWEAVVVDDGSTDKTAEILKAYAAKDARIKPIFAEHGGRGKARNLALENCHGDVVAMLDADDLSPPDRFEKQVKFLQENPDMGAVSGQCVSFSGEPVLDMRKLMPWPTEPEEIRVSLLNGRMRILNGGSMIRRSVFEMHGGYRIELLRAQDYEFFRRISLKGIRLAALPDVVLLYRQESAIPSAKYYLSSEAYKHYADALHAGYEHGFKEFQDSLKGRSLQLMTSVRYLYLYAKLTLRYRGAR